MATQKPISSISYNTEAFLKEKLDAWVNAHIIQTYMYICHKGEDGDKDHIHFRIEPNKKLDPMDLEAQLREYVGNENKPRCVRPFRPSKEEDWFLYAVHDEEYLKLKYHGGDEHEKLPYDWQQIVVPENYDLEIAFIRAKATIKHSTVQLAKRIQQGDNPLQLIQEGENPYVTNAIARAVFTSDYQRLQMEYSKLRDQYYQLKDAVYAFGLEIEKDEDGFTKLTIPESD